MKLPACSWRSRLLAAPLVALMACSPQLEGTDDAPAAPSEASPSAESSGKPFDAEQLVPLTEGVSAFGTYELGSALGTPVATNTTCGSSNSRNPSCAHSSAPDHTYRWTAPYSGSFTFTTSGSSYDTLLHIYDGPSGAALGCNDDSNGTLQSSLTLTLNAGQSISILVDGYGGACGSFRLNISGAGGATCTPTSTPTRSPTWDSRWTQGTSLSLDNAILGKDIGMYRIQWFNGTWSPWYTPGVDDIDWVRNNDGSQRRVWSYFIDHNHQFLTHQ